MDAIVNLTVLRQELKQAFRVNTLGSYNMVKAAVAQGIRRFVQTGPMLVGMDGESGDRWEYDIPGDVPPRPGHNLYAHSKYLGQEICRVFVDYYALEMPVLLYCQFLNPDNQTPINPFPVTWQDSARAIRRALELPTLPASFQTMNILADTPHGIFSNCLAKDFLVWEPRDNLSLHWQDPHYGKE
jgi:hypothetical protein